MTSHFTSQRLRRYVSNETPNNVSVERRQDVSVVGHHDVLLICRDDVSRGRNDDVPSVGLHDISNKSQMKYPTMSQWYVTTYNYGMSILIICNNKLTFSLLLLFMLAHFFIIFFL